MYQGLSTSFSIFGIKISSEDLDLVLSCSGSSPSSTERKKNEKNNYIGVIFDPLLAVFLLGCT